MTDAEKLVNTALDFGQDISRSILEPAQSAIELATGLLESVSSTGADIASRFAQVPIDILRDVHRSAIDVAATVDSTLSDAERVSSLSGNLSRIMKDIARTVAGVFVALRGIVVDDVNRSARAFASKYRRRDADAALGVDGVPLTQTKIGDAGSNTAFGSSNIPRGKKVITTPRGVSIKTIAVQQLGSAGRYKEIVVLNGLRAPYISPGGDGINVLRPGDPMLIPVELEDAEDTNQVISTRDDIERRDAIRYGRDIKINLDTRDFLADARGDLATVEGLENLKQAAHIKVFTKPGDLQVHPWFGFAPEPGEGLTVDLLAQYQLQFRMTLLSDTRIERINELSMNASGDVLYSRVSLTAKDQDDAIALDLRASVG